MSGGFVKLYGSILDSTVWREDHGTRLVWITMLAMADASGIVEASVPGLADRARVTLDECKHALARLMAPDEYSRTQDHEGRRIAVVDGGWQLLNHQLYRHRERRDPEVRREQTREATRRWRERKGANGSSSVSHPVSQCEPIQRQKHTDASRRGVVGDLSSSSRSVANVTTVAGSEIASAREPTPPPAEPPRPTVPSRVEEPPSSHAVAVREPARTLAPTRAGRVYRGRLASSGEIDKLDWWRREVLAALPTAQRTRVPGFTADVAELGPGLARALDQHGELTVRNVVGWATVECGAGRMSPRHYRALFNGDSFEQRVIEAAAHVAGEAADQHAVSPELAAAIAKARRAVEQNRETLAIDPSDERAPPPDIRIGVEADLARAEARLAELLAQSRKPNGAPHHAR